MKSRDWTIGFEGSEGFIKNILSYVKSKSVVIWSIYPSCITTLVALGIRLGVITDKWAEWSRLEIIWENILFDEVNEADRDSFCFWNGNWVPNIVFFDQKLPFLWTKLSLSIMISKLLVIEWSFEHSRTILNDSTECTIIISNIILQSFSWIIIHF